MVTKRQIEKTTVYPLFSLFIQFSAIETRWVFSHAKLMISWLQWLEKKVGCPCPLVSYSHFSTDRAQYQGKSSMFSKCTCTSARQWRHKLCAVRMRNAKQGNDFNCFTFSLLHHILSSLHQRRKSCLKVHDHFRFILKSNINTENVDARICLNERLSCTIAATFLEILAPVHTWRFNVSCFEVLDANKVWF